MKRLAAVTITSLSLVLLASCGKKTAPEPEKPIIHDTVPLPERTGSPGDVLPPSDQAEPTSQPSTTMRHAFRPAFILVSHATDDGGPEDVGKQADNKKVSEVSEMCIRVVGCNISEDSPLRADENINQPPTLYIVVKKGDVEETRSDMRKGWNVRFADSPEYEVAIVQSDDAQYYFDVCDSQWTGSACVASIGPITGKEIISRMWAKKSDDNKTPAIRLEAAKSKATISIEYVGVRRWYRLANVNIPPGAPCRTRFNDDEPELFVKLLRNGVVLNSVAKKSESNVLTQGAWEGNYPRSATNCWSILESSDARYDVEVWDCNRSNRLLFRTSDLRGEQLQKLIYETASNRCTKDRLGRVQFEAVTAPITAP